MKTLITWAFVAFLIGFLTCFLFFRNKLASQKEEYQKQVQTITDKYNKSNLVETQSWSVEKRNNIDTEKTIIRPSGEKIIIRIRDKSISNKKDKNRVSIVAEKHDRIDSRNEEEKKEEKSKVRRDSFCYYKLGLTGLQLDNLKDANKMTDIKNYAITGGIRLGSTPIFVTLETPMISSFYKNIKLGVEIEF